MNKLLSTFLLCLCSLHISCLKEDTHTPSETRPYLTEAKHHYFFTGRILEAIAKGISTSAQKLIFENVEAIKIVYRTKGITNTDVLASGIILIPEHKSVLPIMSYQHQGGLGPDDTPPSLSRMGANELTHAAMIASTGYLVLVPDYLGYGISAHQEHPFEHKASLAQSGIDFIEAAKEYVQEQNLKTKEMIALAGYSEGAQITLAMQHLLEKEKGDSVYKSIVGDGIFLKRQWIHKLLKSSPSEEELLYLLKLIESYKHIYPELSDSWDEYLTQHYAEMIENGNPISALDLEQTSPQSLFNSDFINGVTNGTNLKFIAALRANEIEPWETKTPIFLNYYNKNESGLIEQAEGFKTTFENLNTSIKLKLNEENLDETSRFSFAIQIIKELHKD